MEKPEFEMPESLEELQKLIEDCEKRDRFYRELLISGPASIELMANGRPSHPLAGKTAKAKETGDEIEVEDWFEKIFKMPYLLHDLDRPPLIIYFCRMAIDRSVPVDNDVVCIHCRGAGGLLHNSEIM